MTRHQSSSPTVDEVAPAGDDARLRDILEAIRYVARNCMGQDGIKTIHELCDVGLDCLPLVSPPKAGTGEPELCKPYVKRNHPGHAMDGGEVVVPFRSDFEMECILAALAYHAPALGETQPGLGSTAEAQAFPKTLGLIHQAIDSYVSAIVAREHGGLAENRAFVAICEALGRSPTQEMDARRRALSNPGDRQ